MRSRDARRSRRTSRARYRAPARRSKPDVTRDLAEKKTGWRVQGSGTAEGALAQSTRHPIPYTLEVTPHAAARRVDPRSPLRLTTIRHIPCHLERSKLDRRNDFAPPVAGGLYHG